MIKKTIKMASIGIDDNIEKYVDKLIHSLERYVESKDESAIVDIELSRATNHRSGNILEARVNFRAHNIDVSAKTLKETAHEAIDETRKELLSTLQTQKKKRINFTRRNALRVKNFFKGVSDWRERRRK